MSRRLKLWPNESVSGLPYSSRRLLSLNCRHGSTGPLMGTSRGGGRGGGTSLWSTPRIAMGFEAAEGERLSENGMPRLGGPKGLERVSPWPVDMDGRGLVLMSLPPYPREGAWMGMAAMASRFARVLGRSAGASGQDRWAVEDGDVRCTG